MPAATWIPKGRVGKSTPLKVGETLSRQDVREVVITAMYDRLFAWTRRRSQRTSRSEQHLIEMRTKTRGRGVVIGVHGENDWPLDLTVRYRDRKPPP